MSHVCQQHHRMNNEGFVDDDRALHAYIRALPKVEVHAHLNGCIRESTLLELAQERQVTLSPHLFSSSPSSSSSHHHQQQPHLYNIRPRSLNDCFAVFAEIPNCVDDLPSLRRITREALEDFYQDNVIYLELRSTPKVMLRKTNKKTKQHHPHQHDGDLTVVSEQQEEEQEVTPPTATKRDYVETILSTMQTFEQEMNCHATTSNNKKFTCRLIVAVDRAQSLAEAQENIQLAIDLKTANNNKETGTNGTSNSTTASASEYIVGVDLGGNPTRGNFTDFRRLFQRAREAGLMVTLHCAEVSCGKDDEDDDDADDSSPAEVAARLEASEMLDFGPDRLGHALLLSPKLQERLHRLQIPVETCPTSNVMTLELAHLHHGNLLQGLLGLPLVQWINGNHPIAICTDDPGIFDTNATLELELVAKAFQLNRTQVANLVCRSMQYAFCSDTVKREVQERIQREAHSTAWKNSCDSNSNTSLE